MTGTALILAAHGSRHEPTANALLREWAAMIAARGGFDKVLAAFHQGEPTFAMVLDHTSADDIIVVPVMTSEGYYCNEFLPAELAKNRRHAAIRLVITPPIGVHADIPEMVEVRGLELAGRFGIDPCKSAVALIGHGTRRNPNSRMATQRLAEALRKRGRFAEVGAFFLDEPPAVEEALLQLTRANILVLPFLISGGPHAVQDIPARLGLIAPHSGALPIAGEAHGCRLICDAPIGTDPRLLDIILDLANEKRSSMGGRAASSRESIGLAARNSPAVEVQSAHRSRTLRLGTRGSRLARWQAEHVAERLRAAGHTVEIIEISTIGDRLLDRAIADLPGDTPFTDDIDAALSRDEIDLAVHSLKDMSVRGGLAVAAVLRRGEVSESLVSRDGLRLCELPPGATVGTSSPRRVAQLLAIRPDLVAMPIRGAVDDRVRQVRAGRFDAAILATAGLSRLGLRHEASEEFPLEAFLPAPAQGAMAVQCRDDDTLVRDTCRVLDDAATRRAVTAELEFLRPFEFDRKIAAAAHAEAAQGSPHGLTLRGRLLSVDGRRVDDVSVTGNDPVEIARRAINEAMANWEAVELVRG